MNERREPEPIDLDAPTVTPPSRRSPSENSGSNPIWKLPQRLGRYTLERRLGAGGMAEVFLAHQDGIAGFQKACVVKRILPHLAMEPRFVAMFQREARIAAMLSHTNIAQIYELGEVDGTFFIAMEYVDGAPLNRLARASWRARKPMPLEVVSCAIADAALGLHAAHEQRDAEGTPLHLVHRDISPDNLIINKEGVTKVLDFGVAKTALFGERTATGELKGKIPFLSPEQIKGEPVDGRADLYALGVTFYWLLTGKRPFSAPTDLALMQVVINETPRPPQELNPTIPDAVNDLVVRLLAKDREQRPATGADVHDALAPALTSRRTIVAPFVGSMLAAADLKNDVDPIELPDGFLPSTPHTDVVRAGWNRIVVNTADATAELKPVALDARQATRDEPTFPVTSPADDDERLPRSRAPFVAAAAAVVVALVVGAAVALNRNEPPPPPEVAAVPAPPPEPTPPPPEPAPPPVVATPDVPENEKTEPAKPALEKPAPEKPAPKPERERRRVEPALREIAVKAPPAIAWESDGGKALGTGTTTLKVPAGTRTVVAYDFRRAVRTRVPVAASIDYAALPRGKILPRANPYADAYVGIEKLGTTPVAAVDTVIGTYVVRFVYQGREVKRTVEVKPGLVARVNVDFTAAQP